MPLRTRLFLVVTALLIVSIAATGLVAGANAWRAMTDRAKQDGVVAALMIAQAAGISVRAPQVADHEMRSQLQILTTLLAKFAQLQGNGRPGAGLATDYALRQAANRAGLSAIWLLDGEAQVLATSRLGLERHGSVFVPGDLPAVAAVAAGTRGEVIVDAVTWDPDGPPVDVAATALISGRGALVVARTSGAGLDAFDAIGVDTLLATVASADSILAVWLYGQTGAVSAGRVAAGPDMPAAAEEILARDVRRTGRGEARLIGADIGSIFDGFGLVAGAPVLDGDGLPTGAAVVRLDTAPLLAALHRMMAITAVTMAGMVLVGGLAALLVARQLAKPISTVTDAACAVEARRFDPAVLVPTAQRRDELGRLARVFGIMADEIANRERILEEEVAARTAEVVAQNRRLAEILERTEEDLEQARALQAAILEDRGAGVGLSQDCRALMVPARHIGGDFYDILPLPDGRIGLTIADVSGKGVQAALFMAISRTILRDAARRCPTPADCLARANRLLCRTNPMSLFVTVFYAILDPRTGELAFANGGHNPPMLARAGDGTVSEVPPTDGIALGVMEGMSFDDGTLTLQDGDLLLLFTDGVTEAMDPQGQLFGEERLEAFLKTIPAGAGAVATLEALRKAVFLFGDGAEQSDDLTCLALRYRTPDAA